MRELIHNRRLIMALALLYLSQGIPIGIAMDALPTLLRHDGASLGPLAFLPLVGLPWVLKFLWAPLVDNHWSPRLGRRRSWILPMQMVVMGCLLCLAWIGASVATAAWAVGLLAVASLASATQDIATDGMAAEHFSGELLAKVNAIQVGGVMIGFFIGGAGSLIITGLFGQSIAFMLMLSIPLLSVCVVALLEPDDGDEQALVTSPRASLAHFLRRPLAPSLLLLAFLSAMTAVSGFGLSKLYLNDQGWALEEIGRLGMVGGLVTVVLGCGGGAWLIKYIGLWRSFSLGILLAGCSAFLWFLLAEQWWALRDGLIWICVLTGSLATGITSVAILTAAMSFAGQGYQAGTDVTAVQSTRDFSELLASSFLIALTAHIGYGGAFLGGCVLAAVALIIAVPLGFRERKRTMQAAEQK